MHKFILAISFLLVLKNISAQEAILSIIDAIDKTPLPNVHICTESKTKAEQHYWITDQNGKVANSTKASSKIAISFIGYKTMVTTIEPGKNYTFKLSPNPESIDEIVITGQIKPQKTDQSIYNIQLINQQQIDNRAANNMAELLASELNVNVQSSGVLGSSITMQGLSGEHIKILIDGVPVIGRQNGNIDLNQLNLQNVDHIEIVEGSMSVVYGSNAVAGAINIITKKNLRPKYAIGANSYFESIGNINTDILLTKNTNNHHFNFTAGHNFFNGHRFNNSYRNFDFQPKRQIFGTLDYQYNFKKSKLLITQDAFKEHLIYYGNVFYDSIALVGNDRYRFPTAKDENHFTIRTNTKANFSHSINENSNFDILGAYSYYNRSKLTYTKDLSGKTEKLVNDHDAHDTTLFNTIMSRGTYNYWLKAWEIQSGYDISNETGSGKRITNTKQIGEYAAFGNFKYNPIPSLTFQAGLRLMHNTKYNAPISYSANAKWSPIQEMNLRASYGKGFRSPSLKELYLNFVDVNHNVQGNPDLEPETPINLNISADYNTSKDKNSVRYTLKFYHNRISNKIDFLYDSLDNTKANYINIDGVFKTIGGQADITYKLHPRFTLTTGINYYGNSKIASLNEYTYTPDFITTANYHNIKYLFRINIYYKYFGRQSQFYAKGTGETKSIEERSMAAYNMLDISISRPFFNERLDLAIGAKNLLNVKQINSTGSAGAHTGGGNGTSNIAYGRSFFIKLSYNFTKY